MFEVVLTGRESNADRFPGDYKPTTFNIFTIQEPGGFNMMTFAGH